MNALKLHKKCSHEKLISFGFKKMGLKYKLTIPLYKYKNIPVIAANFTIIPVENYMGCDVIFCKDNSLYTAFYEREYGNSKKNKVLKVVDNQLQKEINNMREKEIIEENKTMNTREVMKPEITKAKPTIAKFSKVSFEQFQKDWDDTVGQCNLDCLLNIYENIKLPKRATKGSAGYDFFSPITFELIPYSEIKIPTGIRVHMDENWVLKCYPRSGLGFKYRLQLNNTVGIIDSDYFYSDNEGHIMLKLTNDSNEEKILTVKAGEGVAQGIFVQYGVTVDDDVTDIRNGGFGSTTKK